MSLYTASKYWTRAMANYKVGGNLDELIDFFLDERTALAEQVSFEVARSARLGRQANAIAATKREEPEHLV